MNISEQVKKLRNYEGYFKGDRVDGNLSSIFGRAADTIESLSVKLAKANTEKPAAHYNDRWVPCNDRLPDRTRRYYIVSVKSTVSDFEYTRPALYDKDGFATNIDEETIAWMPLPDSYKPKQEVNDD